MSNELALYIKHIKNHGLKSVIYSSAVGTRIRRWFLGVVFWTLAAWIIFFYIHANNLMKTKGQAQLVELSSQYKENIQQTIKKAIDISKTLANIYGTAKNDSLDVKISRTEVIEFLKANYPNINKCEIFGVYWDWEAFDGQDDNLKKDPTYAQWYGRMCYYFTKTNGEVVPDKKFVFDEKLFEEVRKTKETMVLSSIEAVVAGRREIVIPILVPILNGEDFYGCVFTYINVKFIEDIVPNINSELDGCNFYVTDGNSNIISNTTNIEYNGKKITEILGHTGLEIEKNTIAENKPVIINNECINLEHLQLNRAGASWMVITIIDKNILSKGIIKRMSAAIILAIIILLLGAIISVLVGFRIGAPIRKMLKGVKLLSQGVLNVNFKLNFKHGDTEITELMIALDKMVQSLKHITGEVKQSSINMNIAGKELAHSAAMMASGANQQASASEEVASAMQEMSSSILRNAENARETEQITNKVVESVLKANDSVSLTVESMKIITDKISIINEIVGKTDLLAVNAAIEAARVGELGKGFTVVASEIRKLAVRSQEAAKEIDMLTEDGVRQAVSSGKLLEQLVPQINKTSELIHEITSSSVEQNNSAIQVNNALQQLNDITQQNAATAEQLSSSADESQTQAENLDDTMSFFKFENTNEDEVASLTKQVEDLLARIDEIKTGKNKNVMQ